MIRHSAATALAVPALLLLAACSAGSGADQPLTSGIIQEGTIDCSPAPNPYPSAGTSAWNSAVGFAHDWYFNTSASPVEVESVSLIDNHNLVLHAAIVYQGGRQQHDIIMSDGWELMGRYANASAWAARQAVPGAVIPPQAPTSGSPDPNRPEYAVVLDISAKTPAGGYAIGQQVTYKQGGNQYTIRSYTGYALVAPEAVGDSHCEAADKAIDDAWAKSSSQ